MIRRFQGDFLLKNIAMAMVLNARGKAIKDNWFTCCKTISLGRLLLTATNFTDFVAPCI